MPKSLPVGWEAMLYFYCFEFLNLIYFFMQQVLIGKLHFMLGFSSWPQGCFCVACQLRFFFFLIYFGCIGLWAVSSCGRWGLFFVAVRGLLIAVASLVSEHRLQARGLQSLWHAGSVVVARGIQSAGSVVVAHGISCSMACGIFPDQRSNQCLLHWQVDS